MMPIENPLAALGSLWQWMCILAWLDPSLHGSRFSDLLLEETVIM